MHTADKMSAELCYSLILFSYAAAAAWLRFNALNKYSLNFILVKFNRLNAMECSDIRHTKVHKDVRCAYGAIEKSNSFVA